MTSARLPVANCRATDSMPYVPPPGTMTHVCAPYTFFNVADTSLSGGIAVEDGTLTVDPIAGRYVAGDGDTPPGNYGADPFIGYDFRFPQEYGNAVGQGVGQTRALVEGRLGYELLPGLFAEAGLRFYDQDDDGAGVDPRPELTRGFSDLFVSVRWGLAPPSYRY